MTKSLHFTVDILPLLANRELDGAMCDEGH